MFRTANDNTRMNVLTYIRHCSRSLRDCKQNRETPEPRTPFERPRGAATPAYDTSTSACVPDVCHVIQCVVSLVNEYGNIRSLSCSVREGNMNSTSV